MVGRLPLADEEPRRALQEAKVLPAAILAIDACKNCLRFTFLFSGGASVIDRGYQSMGIDRNFCAKNTTAAKEIDHDQLFNCSLDYLSLLESDKNVAQVVKIEA
jgi:hypothetical protein